MVIDTAADPEKPKLNALPKVAGPPARSVAEKVPILFAKGDGGIADTYSMLERLEQR